MSDASPARPRANASPARPRAIDLTTGVGAAYTTKMLAEVGWDVVKVEPRGGDPTRRLPSRWSGGEGGAFAFVNYGKRGVQVEDRDQLARLVAAADVVVGDFSPAGCAASGLERSDFESFEPRQAVVSVTPFGLNGPRAEDAASDLVMQALSGMMFLTGSFEQPPMQLPPYAAAISGGLAAGSAALAAARSARTDGRVRRVDVAMAEALTSFTYSETTRYVTSGEVMRREQRMVRGFRTIEAGQGGLYWHFGNIGHMIADAPMDQVAELLQEPRLMEERFQAADSRLEHWDELVALLRERFRTKSAREWFEAADRLHLTMALLQTIDELFDCPQLEARDLWREAPGPHGATIRIPGRPFRLEGGPPEPSRPALARPGEHTAEVLRDWLGEADGE